MFDLQQLLLSIYENRDNGSITDSECCILIESSVNKYADNYIADAEAFYLEGFFDKFKKKDAKKEMSQDEIDKTIQDIKDKKGKLTERDKNKVVNLIICGAIGIAYGLAIVGYENRDAIIAALDNHKMYSPKASFADDLIEGVYESIINNDYTDAKLLLYDSGLYEMVSESTFELIYNLISEAEEDHKMHMREKEIAAKNTDKNLNDLPNKKFRKKKDGSYVDPKKAQQEEMKYDYKASTRITDKKNSSTKGRTVEVHNSTYDTDDIHKKPTESDLKMLQYMRKQAETGDEAAIRKYKQVFKIFCAKHEIEKSSSLYVRYNPDDLNITEWRSGRKVDSKQLTGKENVHALPRGYMLLHASPEDKLKELRPRMQSNKYIGSGPHGGSGQFHDSGRIYFVLQKENSLKDKILKGKKDDVNTGSFGGGGKHIYKLISPISGFYVDRENEESKGLDKSTNVEKFVGKSVFVKTDKPLKVRKLI